eukprot:COSAG04_NODE_9923_length_820_cov_1.062413_3_plen_108_part_00
MVPAEVAVCFCRYHEPKKIDKLLEMCKQLYKYREREEFEEEAEMYTAVLKLAYKVPEEEYRKVKAAGRERARAAGSSPYATPFAPVLRGHTHQAFVLGNQVRDSVQI